MTGCMAVKRPCGGRGGGWDAEADSRVPSAKVDQSSESQLLKLAWDPPAALCRTWVQMNSYCEQIRIGGNQRDS